MFTRFTKITAAAVLLSLLVVGLCSCDPAPADPGSTAPHIGKVIGEAAPQSFICEVKDPHWEQVGQDVWQTVYTGENLMPADLHFWDENGNDITDRIEIDCFRDVRDRIVFEVTDAGIYTATVRAKWDSNMTRTLTFKIMPAEFRSGAE